MLRVIVPLLIFLFLLVAKKVRGLDGIEQAGLLSIINNVTGLPVDWNPLELANGCSWTGLSCDGSLRLIAMYFYFSPQFSLCSFLFMFSDNNEFLDLQGTIGAQLLQFPELTSLKLVLSTNFKGALEVELLPQLFSSDHLQSVYLSNVKVTTVIPPLGDAIGLVTFVINDSGAFGPLPDLPPNVNELRFGYNSFFGGIPLSWSSHAKLKILSLHQNLLSGPLPPTLPLHLTELRLGANQFNGTIPSSYSSHPKLKVLSLYSNDLAGNLLDPLPAKLREMGLGDNRIIW